ncbi:MAG: hypothetical protein QXW78_01990 [Candidatus Thermoplasmatota archaeon]
MSLRDLELWSENLVGKAFEKITEEYLKKYIADATGIKLDRLYRDVTSVGEKRKLGMHDKLSILGEYYSTVGVICISAGEWRSGYSYDSPSLVNMLIFAIPYVLIKA